MKLLFLRHGVAVNRTNWHGADDQRPLTKAGRDGVVELAATLAKLELGVELILSSTHLRARQTAEIVAKKLRLNHCLEFEPLLARDFTARILEDVLAKRDSRTVLLVGHEPDFSRTIGDLTGGARVRLKKAGLARVDLEREYPENGQLVWLIPPKWILTTKVGSRSATAQFP
ncbi:MAG: phosphohistidine phosphatase SixA [Polyangiaceae bacterium]